MSHFRDPSCTRGGGTHLSPRRGVWTLFIWGCAGCRWSRDCAVTDSLSVFGQDARGQRPLVGVGFWVLALRKKHLSGVPYKTGSWSPIGLCTAVWTLWVWRFGRRHLGFFEPQLAWVNELNDVGNQNVTTKSDLLLYWRWLRTRDWGNKPSRLVFWLKFPRCALRWAESPQTKLEIIPLGLDI